MPIDNASKRRAMLGLGLVGAILPAVAGAGLDASWRQQEAGQYPFLSGGKIKNDAYEDQIAEAIAAELNDPVRVWAALFTSETCTAVRTRYPVYKAADLQSLKVAVVPMTIERTRIARDQRQLDYGIGIDLQKMVEPSDEDQLEALSFTAQQIHDFFDDGHALSGRGTEGGFTQPEITWICIKADRRDVYSDEQLYTNRTWETLIFCTVRGFK